MSLPVPLPIDAIVPELLAAQRTTPNAVVVAPPGAGKTTRVPPALVASDLFAGKLVMLEPRRIAARAAARRIAAERGWELGREVGYQVRFERVASAETRLLVVTEGILVRMLEDDPLLAGIDALVCDEVHERSLFSDLALAMARRVQREARPELRLLAMSATLEAERWARFLDAPVLASSGQLHPVEMLWGVPRDERPLSSRVLAGVRSALAATAGDLLVFLPGVGEIRECQEALGELAEQQRLAIVPLFGDLAAAEQDAALLPGARRKVVLATNVAETSVTIEGVGAVVDSGLVRRLRFDPGIGLDRLELGRVSRASAEQRAGRAGRLGPGKCWRLWSEVEHRALLAFETPEIARVDLAWAALQLLVFGERDLSAFPWFEAPEPATLERAIGTLAWLGATDGGGRPTPLGRELARVPLHPRLALLLREGARLGVGREAALAAALLSERDPFRGGRAPAEAQRWFCDLTPRIEALAALASRRSSELALDRGAARSVLRSADQLGQLLPRSARPPAAPLDHPLERALLTAFGDRLARRRAAGSERGVMVGGRGVRLAPTSGVRDPELFLCLVCDAGRAGERAEAVVRLASGVERAWLPSDRLVRRDEVVFDAEAERVVGRRELCFGDLALESVEMPVDDHAAATCLAQAAAADAERALPLDEPAVASFLARLRFLAAALPELALPRFDADELRALLPELCWGRRSFSELRRLPLATLLRARLTRTQLATLEREAPERYRVPSGREIGLSYPPAQPPVLAARIQELFGQLETPRLAGGRVPIVLHLLAPNGRPQQVTTDLASFWRTTYPQVRKELAGRYPKHPWPDDPLHAAPTSRPKPRGAPISGRRG